MFRELIPRLADHYRVIAPDLLGFGFTEVPAARKYTYSFDDLALTMEAFTEALKIKHYALYVFDYGAPTGFRLAMAHPERSVCPARRAAFQHHGNRQFAGCHEIRGEDASAACTATDARCPCTRIDGKWKIGRSDSRPMMEAI